MNKKIYACYSPSHTKLLEQHFLPSIPSGFDVVLRKLDQVCETGEYKDFHWGRAMVDKVGLIRDAIESETEPFVFSDVDVRFYDFSPEHFERDMQGANGELLDLCCQDDDGHCCAGFMFIRPSAVTRKLFRMVFNTIPEFDEDQAALNSILRSPIHVEGDLKVALLPKSRYWNIGPSSKSPAWDGTSAIPNIAMHHANWVIGLDKKLQLMNKVQALYIRKNTF